MSADDADFHAKVRERLNGLTPEMIPELLNGALAARSRECAWQLARGMRPATESTPSLDSLDLWIDLLTLVTKEPKT
jgi:hypothetical protein